MSDEWKSARARALAGGPAAYREKLAAQGKMPVRERIALLCDAGAAFVEDNLLGRIEEDLPGDGCITGVGVVHGRSAMIIAHDPTVKAGSWGRVGVEKMIVAQERAAQRRIPLLYLVDAAGARIDEQIDTFPGRRHIGRIFSNQVRLSGQIPQACILFGPSPAGAAYMPSFSDVVVMVDGHASAYLASPRMVSEAIGEETTLEELGGARMHCEVSGLGDVLVPDERAAIDWLRDYMSFLPQHADDRPPRYAPEQPANPASPASVLPDDAKAGYDVRELLDCVVDAGSLLEIKERFAPEVVTALARLDGHTIGVVANQPAHLGGTLFVDSSDKAARFLWLCEAWSIPVLFLADVPGFMVGTAVERQGIIRHGAKMVAAVARLTVPRILVVVRKCYGAGLYAMCGPAFDPEAVLAFPGAEIAVMGPEAATNAVHFHRIQAITDPDERAAYVEKLRTEYREDIDLVRLASRLLIDDIVDPVELRGQLVARFDVARRPRTQGPVPILPV